MGLHSSDDISLEGGNLHKHATPPITRARPMPKNGEKKINKA